MILPWLCSYFNNTLKYPTLVVKSISMNACITLLNVSIFEIFISCCVDLTLIFVNLFFNYFLMGRFTSTALKMKLLFILPAINSNINRICFMAIRNFILSIFHFGSDVNTLLGRSLKHCWSFFGCCWPTVPSQFSYCW